MLEEREKKSYELFYNSWFLISDYYDYLCNIKQLNNKEKSYARN